MTHAETDIPSCPYCGSVRVIPIAYGLPSAEGMARARRGEIVLGGCCLSRESPRWACRKCERQFGNHEEELRAFFSRLRKPGAKAHSDTPH